MLGCFRVQVGGLGSKLEVWEAPLGSILGLHPVAKLKLCFCLYIFRYFQIFVMCFSVYFDDFFDIKLIG